MESQRCLQSYPAMNIDFKYQRNLERAPTSATGCKVHSHEVVEGGAPSKWSTPEKRNAWYTGNRKQRKKMKGSPWDDGKWRLR